MVNEILRFSMSGASSKFDKYAYRPIILGIGERGVVIRFKVKFPTDGNNVNSLYIYLTRDDWNDNNPAIEIKIRNYQDSSLEPSITFYDEVGNSQEMIDGSNASHTYDWFESIAMIRSDIPNTITGGIDTSYTNIAGVTPFENLILGRYKYLTLTTETDDSATIDVDYVSVKEISEGETDNILDDTKDDWTVTNMIEVVAP